MRKLLSLFNTARSSLTTDRALVLPKLVLLAVLFTLTLLPLEGASAAESAMCIDPPEPTCYWECDYYCDNFCTDWEPYEGYCQNYEYFCYPTYCYTVCY